MDSVKTDEILVMSWIPLLGHAFIRLAEPSYPAPVVPETLVLLQKIPEQFSRYRILLRNFAYARLVTQPGSCRVNALEFERSRSIPLEQLPVGLVVDVRHVPLYAQPPFQTMIWPDWQPPPKNRWLIVPSRGSH